MLYQIPYKKVIIKDSFSQWASCSGDGNLNFSWRVILVPSEVIAYLVVHELAHVHIRNHSADYWTKVEQMMPDYLKYDNLLKEYDHILSIFKMIQELLFQEKSHQNPRKVALKKTSN